MAYGDHDHDVTAASNHTHSYPVPGPSVATYPIQTTNGFAPYTGTGLGGAIYPGTTSAPLWDQCIAGHEGDVTQAEYMDGLVVTTCVTCGARMTMKSVTGGLPHLRLKAFMELLLGSPDHQDLLVKDFLDIQAVVEAEREKFKEVEGLLETARKILRGEPVE